MIETVIALIVILTLIIALLQIASLGSADTRALINSRKEAADKAILPLPTLSSAKFLKTWEEGTDQSRYTADDVAINDEPVSFINMVVNKASADENGWTVYDNIPNNPFNLLKSMPYPSAIFGLVEGEASETVSLLPGTRHLIYDAEAITIKAKTWMVKINDIY